MLLTFVTIVYLCVNKVQVRTIKTKSDKPSWYFSIRNYVNVYVQKKKEKK